MKDFDILHRGLQGIFFATLLAKKDFILELARKVAPKYPELNKLFTNFESLDETAKDSIALYCLPYLFPNTVSKKRKNGKAWKPSKLEIREGFIFNSSSSANVDSDLELKLEKLRKYNCPLQPLVLVVGESIINPESVFIVLGNQKYKLNTVAQAVDTCFKVIHVTNTQYQHECSDLWLVIQRGFYHLKTKFDYNFEQNYDYVNQSVRGLLHILQLDV